MIGPRASAEISRANEGRQRQPRMSWSEKISSDLGLVSDTVRNKMNVRSKTEEKVWKIGENAFRVQKKA